MHVVNCPWPIQTAICSQVAVPVVCIIAALLVCIQFVIDQPLSWLLVGDSGTAAKWCELQNDMFGAHGRSRDTQIRGLMFYDCHRLTSIVCMCVCDV